VAKLFSPNHPKQRLLFFVAQDIDSEIQKKVRSFIDKLARSREWVIRPPKIVDSSVDDGSLEIDSPVVTVGGYVEIYSAFPGTDLPKDIDRQHLEEVEYLIEQIRKFSENNMLAFEFELDRNFVGSIEDGVLDRTLREGLLGEWRKQLESHYD
jgi:hypothetical protein